MRNSNRAPRFSYCLLLTLLCGWFHSTAGAQSSQADVLLERTAAHSDIAAFEEGIRARWSYYRVNGVDARPTLNALREKAASGISVQQLGIELQKIIALFIDGHARVNDLSYPQGYLPFSVHISGDRLVAYSEDRTQWLDPRRPYLEKLDGRPVAEWLRAAEKFQPKGSPQFRLYRSVRFLPYLNVLRRELGLPEREVVTVEVAAADRSDRRTITVSVAQRLLEYGNWPMRDSHLLPENIGYLRLTEMRDWSDDLVDRWMPYFRTTRGLIVDVRGNGGGTRDALKALFPYLMAPDEDPAIGNIAALRLFPGYPLSLLTTERSMHPADSHLLTKEERVEIGRLMTSWQPQWKPFPDEFSEWHYLVLSRRLNPRAYFYDKPVVLLIDYGCFSATDIFAAAFKNRPRVTLVGTPTGGGSALVQTFTLPNSRLVIRVGAMISYRRDGTLHDGNGIHPDVRIEPTPESFLKFGEDNQLRQAIKILLARSKDSSLSQSN